MLIQEGKFLASQNLNYPVDLGEGTETQVL